MKLSSTHPYQKGLDAPSKLTRGDSRYQRSRRVTVSIYASVGNLAKSLVTYLPQVPTCPLTVTVERHAPALPTRKLPQVDSRIPEAPPWNLALMGSGIFSEAGASLMFCFDSSSCSCFLSCKPWVSSLVAFGLPLSVGGEEGHPLSDFPRSSLGLLGLQSRGGGWGSPSSNLVGQSKVDLCLDLALSQGGPCISPIPLLGTPGEGLPISVFRSRDKGHANGDESYKSSIGKES